MRVHILNRLNANIIYINMRYVRYKYNAFLNLSRMGLDNVIAYQFINHSRHALLLDAHTGMLGRHAHLL